MLVDAMRGRFQTWTRVRVNLERVPQELRPPQEPLDPNDDLDDWSGRSDRASGHGDERRLRLITAAGGEDDRGVWRIRTDAHVRSLGAIRIPANSSGFACLDGPVVACALLMQTR